MLRTIKICRRKNWRSRSPPLTWWCSAGGSATWPTSSRKTTWPQSAFWQNADCGQVVFLELVGQVAEPPAEHHHVSGGERERQFLRRQIFIVLSIWVWLQRVLNQLAGVKATAFVFSRVELDTGAILAGTGVTGIWFEGHRR